MQDAQDIQAARKAQLPPLQSVTELTSAAAPPQRGEVPVTAQAAPSSAGLDSGFLPHEQPPKRESSLHTRCFSLAAALLPGAEAFVSTQAAASLAGLLTWSLAAA